MFDLHNDFPTALHSAHYEKYIDDCGENTVTAAIWTSELNSDTALRAVCAITDRLCNIERAAPIPIAIEDLGFLAHNRSYAAFDFSRYFYCSLTWNYNNGFCGGALDDGALTENGKELIDVINASGCAIDLAHLNRKSFYSVLDRAARPLCSHTGFNNHKRSLDAAQISVLVERNGVIGLCTVSAFTDAENADDFTAVIDRFVQKYGADYLAIGTDFNGSTDIPRDLADYAAMEAVKLALSRRGYAAADLEKIFCKNAQDLYNHKR